MMGRKGLESIPNVGPRLAEVAQDLLNKLLVKPSAGFAPHNSVRLPQFPAKGY
jgi:hypothetical protein